MKAKKATPTLNIHNQRLYTAWSAAELYQLFAEQQQQAFEQGVIARKIPGRQLMKHAERWFDEIKPHIAKVDTTDKAKKLSAKLKETFANSHEFARAVSSTTAGSAAECIATLQDKPMQAVREQSQLTTRLMTVAEATLAKDMLKKHLNLIGRGFVDPQLPGMVLGYSGVRNASCKLGNTGKETLLARAMMLRLEGIGYDRIIDGADHIRYHHKSNGNLSIIFSRAGIFVRAYVGDGTRLLQFGE